MPEALNGMQLSFLKSGTTLNLWPANQPVSAAEGSRDCEPRKGAMLLRSSVRLSLFQGSLWRLFPGG